MSRVGAAAVLAGVGLVAAHALVGDALVRWTARPALVVEAVGPRVVDDPATPAGRLVGGAKAVEDTDGAAPGLVRHRWTVRHRGGVERTVGRVRLVGPLQDVAAPPCGGRLAVGQRLLDDGVAGDGDVAAVVERELTAALRGVDVWGAGDFRRLRGLTLRWTSMFEHPFDAGLFPPAALAAPVPTGYLRVAAVAVFDRVEVPIVVGALPRVDGGQLGFTVGVRARLDFDNRVLDWMNEKVGGDALVTRMARGQIDASLVAALGPPPPLPLPGGRTLVVELCPGRPVEVVSGSHAAVALRWRLGGPAGEDGIRPPDHPPVTLPPPDPGAAITLDLDLDGVNGLAYELWRTGTLDELLGQLDLPGRFNGHPLVRELLSLRLGGVRLGVPPTMSRGKDNEQLRLAVALDVAVEDGALATPGSAWGVLDVGLGGGAAAGGPPRITTAVALAGLDLTCEPEPGVLTACYPDLVAAVRGATGDVHALMSDALGGALTALFVDRRLADDAAPAALAITGARGRVVPAGDQPVVRVELDAHLVQ